MSNPTKKPKAGRRTSIYAVCRKCRVRKELNIEFFNKRDNKFGWYKICKKCRGFINVLSKRRRYDPIAASKKQRMRSTSGKANEATKRMYLKYPEKFKAREKVHRAVKSGLLVKKSCETCGDEKSEAHHPDYNKPLEVVWLCKRHHMLRHRKSIPIPSLPSKGSAKKKRG